jgi:hypothetical protein
VFAAGAFVVADGWLAWANPIGEKTSAARSTPNEIVN